MGNDPEPVLVDEQVAGLERAAVRPAPTNFELKKTIKTKKLREERGVGEVQEFVDGGVGSGKRELELLRVWPASSHGGGDYSHALGFHSRNWGSRRRRGEESGKERVLVP